VTLEEIRRLCEAATPGPWYDDVGIKEPCVIDLTADLAESLPRRFFAQGPEHRENADALKDARFIAAARELVPKLLAVAGAARDLLNGEDWGTRANLRRALNELQKSDLK
jgi:hypothetical protein